MINVLYVLCSAAAISISGIEFGQKSSCNSKYLLFKLAVVKEETEGDTERLYLTGSLIEGAVHLWNNLLFK